MRTVCLPDKWSATISLTLSEPQPQHGTVQLNAERGASDELISCDVNRADFLKAVSDVLGVVVIDPEDREQVERLAVRLYEASGFNHVEGEVADALREFANPTPQRVWTDGDVVQHPDGNYTAQRHDGDWRTTTSKHKWGNDEYVTNHVTSGRLVVLREQAAEVTA